MQDVVEDTQGSVQRLEATCAAFREHSRGTTRICAPAQIWLDVLHTSVWGVYIIILYSEKRFRRLQSQRLLVSYASFLLMPHLALSRPHISSGLTRSCLPISVRLPFPCSTQLNSDFTSSLVSLLPGSSRIPLVVVRLIAVPGLNVSTIFSLHLTSYVRRTYMSSVSISLDTLYWSTT